MLPSAIEWLRGMPLTAGGKIDHRQLPKPTFRKTRRAAGKAPCTPVEKRLARIWSELLSVEDLGIDDNFFQLGGHSLLAVKAMTRIRDEFQVDLPLAKIFTAPTLAQFALEIDRVHQRSGIFSGAGTEGELDKTQAAPFENTLVRIGPGEGTPLYLVHGLGGYITNLVPLARELNDRYDVYALEAVGPFDDRPPHASIPEMAEYYVAAVRRRQPDGPYLLAGWSMGGTIAWEMCRQLIAQDQTVGPLTLIDAHPLWTYGSNLRFGFVASRLLDQLGPAFADIRSLPKAKRWQALIDRAGEYQGPGAVSIGRLIRTCEAHLSAGAAYVPERIGVDVTALWAKQRWGRPLTSPWRSRARSYVARTVPGDHYSMLEPTHVGQLAAQWRRLIAWDSNESRKAG